MKKYIVGGFVRDRIMGLKPKDKDYVLVGAKPRDIEYLKSIGYEQVGKDFPVYLSPEGNEHALARIERKVGNGYNGFEVETEGVTLEDDLKRRDFTINAVAYDPVLKIHIDPYGGKNDIKNKVLRVVDKKHFGEDPLRVLRLARFAARFSDFTIDPETLDLVKTMVHQGQINFLTRERVYVEFEKAFSDNHPGIFLKILKDIGALELILPNFKGTREEFKLIEHITENSTEQYQSEFIWAVLLNGAKAENNQVGLLKMPVRFIKFSDYVSKHKDEILKFRRSTPEEMVNTISEMGVKNKGGEEFLYKVLEYFILRREIDLDLEDLFLKVYGRFDAAPVGDIESMLRDGTLKPGELWDYVRKIRVDEVKKMF